MLGQDSTLRTIPPQTPGRTVQARFYPMSPGEDPLHVEIEGTIYRRDDDQEGVTLFLRGQDLEAALLALIPDESRKQAERLLLELADTKTSILAHRQDLLQARMVEFLPQHKAMVNWVFDPEEHDITLSEYTRHQRCIMVPQMQKGGAH